LVDPRQERPERFVYDSLSWGTGLALPDEPTLSGRRLDWCLRDLDPVRGRVLELGCARGMYIRSIQRQRSDLEAHGSDLNLAALALNRSEPAPVSWVGMDAQKLAYADESFDAVVLFDLLEHLPSPESCLAEIRRVLRPGGFVHAYVPCEGQPGTLHWAMWKLRLGHELKLRHRGHLHHFSAGEVVSLFESAGLKVCNVRRSGYWLEQVLDALFYLFLDLEPLRAHLWSAHGSRIEGEGSRGLRRLRDLAFRAGYWETRLLPLLPWAMGTHLSASKAAR